MENSARTGLHDFTLASRKAEQAALRRFQAAAWLESLVGPLGISREPSEKEFISCLRSGLILCNAINKINPGAVPKVVENISYIHSFSREPQLPPAYQYFENVRNFLVAVEDLKLPAFEASDLERDTLEVGSALKVVDCILALKSYHEWKQMNCGNSSYKHARSPLVMHSSGGSSQASAAITSGSCRRLDVSAASEKHLVTNDENQKLEDSIVKVIAEFMVGAKENIDKNPLALFRKGSQDSFKLLSTILSSCSEELKTKFPELKPVFEGYLKERRTISHAPLTSSSPKDLFILKNSQNHRACMRTGNCSHRRLLKMQEKELLDLKVLLSRTKSEFKDLQLQLLNDLKELGSQVQEMSIAALGYHRVLHENRKLYNMVQDLKGNIRVYCRIRPIFRADTRSTIEFIGEDGSLVISDPSKPQKDGRKVFKFNRVFSPAATQDEVFKDTQPLIRSAMDGYNVCIFAYGQTGSGKTHTMSGPSKGSKKEMGINYLALDDLFQISNERKDMINYDIHVQMVEIYNEQVWDLLAEDSSTTKLEIRSCASENGLSLPDATMHYVKSITDVLHLMKFGEVNRAVNSTAINNRSSRSHSILSIHIHGKGKSGSILRSCLHLVDLAGSERIDKSEVTGDRLKEAQYINKSLSCLGDVIMALAQKGSHIPYCNSKLTLLLQDSLGGHAKTLMFAHVSPEVDSFGETVSTLKFAQRVSTVELGAARANKESNEVTQLKEQVEILKKALANKEAQKPIAVTERTPPHTRRLSIENGSTVKTQKVMNLEHKKRTKTPVSTRARRLSLEGPRYVLKDNIQIKSSAGVNDHTPREAVSIRKSSQFQDAEAVSKSYAHFSSNGNSVVDMCSTGQSYQKQEVKADGMLPKTPEPQLFARNGVQILMQNELTVSAESRTKNGKGSQIRKSIRTIGKFINGKEKWNQQNLTETKSPRKTSDGKSPLTANSRSHRRQSLTGIQTLGSRRSSLGGKPIDCSFANDTRNAKTPPPVHPLRKTVNRWV